MVYTCIGCGYKTEDEDAILLHALECKTEPETKWGTYAAMSQVDFQPFSNASIVEEEPDDK